eukprot:621619-Rhodomonas_salina.2
MSGADVGCLGATGPRRRCGGRQSSAPTLPLTSAKVRAAFKSICWPVPAHCRGFFAALVANLVRMRAAPAGRWSGSAHSCARARRERPAPP